MIRKGGFQEPSRPVCALILDFDGVILESVGIKTQAFRELFSFRPDHVDEIVEYHSRNTGVSRFDKFRYIYREILKEPLSEDQFTWLSEQYAGLVVEGVVASPFVHGAREFLEKCSEKIPLFVVSASPREELVSIIGRRGLSPYFRKVYGAPTRKEQAIREIMAATGSDPEQTLFVGDALNDLKAARDSGVRFAGRQPPEDPDRFIGEPGVEAGDPGPLGPGKVSGEAAMLIQVSYPLETGSPLYPGTPPPSVAPFHTIGEVHASSSSTITFNTHSGTHIDAPRHFCPGGDSVADILGAGTVFSPAGIVDIPKTGDTCITPGDIEPFVPGLRGPGLFS